VELNAQHGDNINGEYPNTKKTCWLIRIEGPLCVKDANRHVNAHEAEEIEKEWRQWRKDNNILGEKAPADST
jgi:hypothetical protein